jgi:hypothetical protein
MELNNFFEDGVEFGNGEYGVHVHFCSIQLNKCVKKFNEKGIENAVFISSVLEEDYNEKDLNVLNRIQAKRITINPFLIQDFSGLNSQKNLVLLKIMFDAIKSPVDFNNFPKLHVFEGYYTKNLSNLFFRKSLKFLRLWKYDSPHGDLSELGGLSNLEELHIIQSKFSSCKGLEKLRKLKILGLAYNKDIEVFNDSNADQYDQLEVLEFEVCKKIDLETLKGLNSLKTLKITNNGKVTDLEPVLKKMPLLETLEIIDTELTNPNNVYLLKQPSLREVWLTDKKNYRLKTKQINEALNNPEKKIAIIKEHK